MSTVSIQNIIEAVLGGETIRWAPPSARVLAIVSKVDVQVTVPEEDGVAVLWEAAESPVTAFSFLAVIVDPSTDFNNQNAARQLTVEFSGPTDTVALRVRGETPLILGADDIGSDLDNLDEVITMIRVKNENAVGDPAGSNDIKVRLLLF